MDINSFKQGPRTAGISIFHDGLPKLASVHCYDRGAVATFGLQTCAPKRPIDTFPIRPIPNHISSKGVLMSQRLYGDQKHHMMNQSKLYAGTFFPPGSEPRLQFVDGRPIIIPSTFENKFIPRDCFDTSLNKSKSVIYNERAASQYYKCCSQYASLDGIHKCPDEMNKWSLQNCMPELTYNCPYPIENDNAVRRGYSLSEYRTVKPSYGPSPSEIAHQQREMYRQQRQQQQQQQQQPLPNPVPTIYPQQRVNQSLPPTYRTTPEEYNKNQHPTDVGGVIINVESITDTKTNNMNDHSPNNVHREPTYHIIRSSSYNGVEPTDRDSIISPRHQNDSMDGPRFRRHSNPSPRGMRNMTRCNACQKELGTSETSVYNNNTLLCQQCANKNRMWGSMKNLPGDGSSAVRSFEKPVNEQLCCNRSYSSPLSSDTSRQNNPPKGNDNTPIVIEIDETNEDETIQNSVNSNRPKSTNDNLTAITPRKPPCLKCLQKNQNRSLKRFSPKEGVTNSDGTPCKPIVINLDDEEDGKPGEKNCDAQRSSEKKSEVVNENNLRENSNNTNETFDVTLDIDEKSFDSFINNNMEDENNYSRDKIRTPVDEVNMMEINDRTIISEGDNESIVYNQKIQEQNNFDDITRKRKINCPSLPNLERQLEQDVSRNTKSYPPSPTYLIDEGQLQTLRNTVVPVLKAKKWIRENSVDNGSS